jgi:hypothetical protein
MPQGDQADGLVVFTDEGHYTTMACGTVLCGDNLSSGPEVKCVIEVNRAAVHAFVYEVVPHNCDRCSAEWKTYD